MKNPNKQANLAKMPGRSLEQEADLIRIEREAIADFYGSFDDLEGALGMLRLGDHVGWRVLVLIHNKRTIRKFEDILGIRIRDYFPAEGVGSKRSVGYTIALKLGNFWKAVSGALKIPDRREIAPKVDEGA